MPAYRSLTKEQDRVNSLPLDGSFLVAGPPGTGKTVVALYRASMLQKQRQTVNILTYSRVLCNYLSNGVRELNLGAEVSTYHSWIFGKYRERFVVNPPMMRGNKFEFNWDKILERFGENPPEPGSLPYLIVDEGQDLPQKFYLLGRYMAKNITIFADENQMLTETNSTLAEIRSAAGITTPTYFLTQNHRNSLQIAKLAACFYSGLETGKPAIPTRSALPVVLRRHIVESQAVDQIIRLHHTRPNDEIGVLLPTQALVKSYVNRLRSRLGAAGSIQYYYRDHREDRPRDTLDFDRVAIRVLTYRSAKGLDFDAVFLPEIQAYSADPTSAEAKMQLYVLLSRARERLNIYYRGEETSLVRTLHRHLAETQDSAADDAIA